MWAYYYFDPALMEQIDLSSSDVQRPLRRSYISVDTYATAVTTEVMDLLVGPF